MGAAIETWRFPLQAHLEFTSQTWHVTQLSGRIGSLRSQNSYRVGLIALTNPIAGLHNESVGYAGSQTSNDRLLINEVTFNDLVLSESFVDHADFVVDDWCAAIVGLLPFEANLVGICVFGVVLKHSRCCWSVRCHCNQCFGLAALACLVSSCNVERVALISNQRLIRSKCPIFAGVILLELSIHENLVIDDGCASIGHTITPSETNRF